MFDVDDSATRGQTTITVRGPFDTNAALCIRERLIDAVRSTRVVIDLTCAAGIQDSALAIIAEAMRVFGTFRVSMRGLTEHHRRILWYMGVDSPSPPVCRAEPALA